MMQRTTRTWVPIVAEREAARADATGQFPCRGEYNRYRGCIGARRCRASGVTICILGRWPDEAPAGAVGAEPIEPSPPAVPVVPSRSAPARPAAAGTPAAGRFLIGIVHGDGRVAQQVRRQVASAGYEAVAYTGGAAWSALTSAARPAALLIDGAASAGDSALLRLAAEEGVPVLRLPPGLRDGAGIAAATRMAVVWLTVTLRAREQSLA